jgi:hypothetical protein
MSVKAPSHPDLAQPPGGTARVIRELDHARKSGVHREIVIPPCPERLVELRAALDGAEPDLAAVSRIASRDVAMAGTLVRNANCARFAAGQPVATVGQAMNRLGLETTSALMTGFLARHALPVRHPRLQGFWDRATLRSTALALVARRLPGLSVDLAYSFGLFCDVGMPVLAQCLRGYGGTLVEAAARIDRPLVATENANHRTDHCVVGVLAPRAAVAAVGGRLVGGIRWCLPLPIRSARPMAFSASRSSGQLFGSCQRRKALCRRRRARRATIHLLGALGVAADALQRVQARVVHRRGGGHRAGVEGLHLVGLEAVALEPEREVHHVLVAGARVRGDEVRDQVLLLAGLAALACSNICLKRS